MTEQQLSVAATESEAQRAFREVLPGRLAALRAASRVLEDPAANGAESARRIAGALRLSGEAAGLTPVVAAAAAVEGASDAELTLKVAELIDVLRRTTPAGDAASVTILLVEDDPLWLRIYRQALEAPDRTLVCVPGAAQADALLRQGGVGLVILDLVLPDGDGRNLLVRWREQPETAHVPVIVVSGRTMPHVRSECFALGADAFFEKPVDRESLAAAVAAALHRKAQPDASSARAAHAPAGPSPALLAEPAAGSVRVLLAEDDPIVARVVKHRLGRDGMEVRHFADAEDALAAAAEGGYGLAILDVKLPGMDGFALLERVRALPGCAEVPVLMLTSMGSEEDILRGLRLGADDYVVKPFSPAELLGRVHRLLVRR
ncbi:MAG TPA: response regulator [Longimicrobiales bacterium]